MDGVGSSAAKRRFDMADEAATCRLAQDIAAGLQNGDLVTLSGDLGAGKTTFARALIRAASGDAGLDVPSPTFPIRIDYAMLHLDIVHVDFYRIAGVDEVVELGLEDAIDDAVLLVEWPDRIDWPSVANRLDVTITPRGERRTIQLAASGSWPERLERSFRVREFLDQSGFPAASRLHVVGDASSKAFERIDSGTRETVILMNSPARVPGPAIWNGRSYDEVAHRALDLLPFLAIGSAMADAGFHVPAIHAQNRADGLVLMEDLGTETIINRSGEPVVERYEAAIDLLVRLHGQDWPKTLSGDGETYRVSHYDTDALLIEVSLFADWFVPHRRGQAWSPDERGSFLEAWRDVLSDIDGAAHCWVMRDFHSPNILWQSELEGLDRLGVIDIQDTLIGHPAYDVASLAQDARVEISTALEARLYRRYCLARAPDPDFHAASFAEAYAILGAQRATKVLGAFTRLAFHDDKPGYETYLPRVKEVLSRNLKHPVLSGLDVWYAGLLENS